MTPGRSPGLSCRFSCLRVPRFRRFQFSDHNVAFAPVVLAHVAILGIVQKVSRGELLPPVGTTLAAGLEPYGLEPEACSNPLGVDVARTRVDI